MLLLPQRDERAAERAKAIAVRERELPQPGQAIDGIAIRVEEVVRDLGALDGHARETGRIVLRVLLVRPPRQIPDPETARHDPERDRDRCRPATREQACAVGNQQVEEREVEIDGPVLEVITTDRSDIDRVRNDQRQEQQRHEAGAPAQVQNDAGDDQRCPQPDCVFEEEREEIRDAGAPPQASPR